MNLFDITISRRLALQGAATIAGAGLIGFTLNQTTFAHGQDATPTPDAYPKASYTAKEYAFDGPTTLPAGLNEITFENHGTMDHHAMFLQLHDGKTVADLAAVKDLPGLFAVSTSVGGPGSIGPEQSATVVLDLAAGSYVLACIIPDADGVPHMAKGMAFPIAVKAADDAKALAEPTPDATFELTEYGFPDFPKTVTAGAHIWKVTNVGAQLHEIVIYRLADGVTSDQALAIFGAPADPMAGMDMGTPSGAPAATASPAAAPFVGISGVAPIAPQQTNWLLVDFEPANYLAICFIPDSASGAPHFSLGMAMPFTVS